MVAERLVASLRSLHGLVDIASKAESTRSGGTLDEAPDQSAKEILRGSLVEQVFPAEYDAAGLSTTETDPESEPIVADGRALEKACGYFWRGSVLRSGPRGSRLENGETLKRTLVTVKRTLAIGSSSVNCTTILRAVLVVVLESCERYFDRV